MPWTFRAGRLSSPIGESWPARSGSGRLSGLPIGEYRIGTPTIIENEGNESYTDNNGLAWWCAIFPQFYTRRTGLGIHPDGGAPGTAGCIGITSFDTRTCYESLRSTGDRVLNVE